MESDVEPRQATAEAQQESRLFAGLLAVFVAIAVLALADLAADLRDRPEGLLHVVLEGAIALVALGGVVWIAVHLAALLKRIRALSAEAAELATNLVGSRQEAEKWRAEAKELISGLSLAIDAQLDAWGLSPAEKDVALLLLKGLSHKEVGEIRQVGEATVRQQARSLYKKAGLGGRADLAAFFLEDLLDRAPPLPPAEGPNTTKVPAGPSTDQLQLISVLPINQS